MALPLENLSICNQSPLTRIPYGDLPFPYKLYLLPSEGMKHVSKIKILDTIFHRDVEATQVEGQG